MCKIIPLRGYKTYKRFLTSDNADIQRACTAAPHMQVADRPIDAILDDLDKCASAEHMFKHGPNDSLRLVAEFVRQYSRLCDRYV